MFSGNNVPTYVLIYIFCQDEECDALMNCTFELFDHEKELWNFEEVSYITRNIGRTIAYYILFTARTRSRVAK